MKAMKKVLVSALAAALVVTAAAPAGAATSPVKAPKAINGKATVKGVTVKTSKKGTGKNVKTIGKNAFKGCKKLKTITLANKKVTIKKGAFAGLNTKKITIKAPKMSKKALKKFKKALKKAGFKGKVK